MSSLNRAKQERVIEAVRHGLEGDAALSFVHESGFKLNAAGITRHLRAMGGRGRISALIHDGKSNHEILAEIFPNDDDVVALPQPAPNQTDFFDDTPATTVVNFGRVIAAQFETTKMTLVLPNDVYQALRAASRAEGKSRNDVVVDVLTSALARMPALEPLGD